MIEVNGRRLHEGDAAGWVFADDGSMDRLVDAVNGHDVAQERTFDRLERVEDRVRGLMEERRAWSAEYDHLESDVSGLLERERERNNDLAMRSAPVGIGPGPDFEFTPGSRRYSVAELREKYSLWPETVPVTGAVYIGRFLEWLEGEGK